MYIRVYLCLTFSLLCPLKTEHFSSTYKQILPPIAKFAWGQVGKTCTLQLEETLGKALHLTGGHPKSRCLWRCKDHGCFLSVDGFEWFNDTHRYVIDDLQIRRKLIDPFHLEKIPTAKTKSCPCIFLGGIRLGMKRQQVVLYLLKQKISFKDENECLIIISQGYVQVNPQMSYREWTSSLSFKKTVLDSITVRCAENSVSTRE